MTKETDKISVIVPVYNVKNYLEDCVQSITHQTYPDLEILLKGLHVDTLYLIGGLTDVCIHYTAVDAHQHDYFIRVVTDAVAGSSEEAHRYALKAVQYLQRDALVTTADIESALE